MRRAALSAAAAAAQPHVSSALRHLRWGVTASGLALALCLAAQLLIWGFVHFTDVRHQELKPVEREQAPLTVVNSSGRMPIQVEQPEVEGGAPVNVVPSTGAIVLEQASELVQTVGVFAGVILFVMMFQGVVVAGGARVPGVEQAVTAGTWALVLVMLAMPWRGFFPDMTYPGVFQSLDGLAGASEALRSGGPESMGGPAFYGMFLILPLLMIAGCAAVVLRFRAGVEAGVIVTHASQLDEKLEREIRERKLGELSKPRAVGALNQAIGLASGETIERSYTPSPPPTPVPAPPPPSRPRSPMSARPQGEEPPLPATPQPPGAPRRPI